MSHILPSLTLNRLQRTKQGQRRKRPHTTLLVISPLDCRCNTNIYNRVPRRVRAPMKMRRKSNLFLLCCLIFLFCNAHRAHAQHIPSFVWLVACCLYLYFSVFLRFRLVSMLLTFNCSSYFPLFPFLIRTSITRMPCNGGVSSFCSSIVLWDACICAR